jgi:hypothetical protein
LVFITRDEHKIAKIGCLDENGIISVWNIIDIKGQYDDDEDYNMAVWGSIRMSMVLTDNLTLYPNVIDPLCLENPSFGMDVEFDPADPQVFFFSTSQGLFKMDMKLSDSAPTKMDNIGLNAPTALSMSDKGYLLAAYSCGSIA